MTTFSSFKRSLRTLADFDDDADEQSHSHDVVPVLSTENVIGATRRLVIIAIIDHLCSLYEPSPNRREKLYKALCDALIQAQIISPAWTAHEFSSLRRQFNNGFINLLQAARDSISQDVPLVVSAAGIRHQTVSQLLLSCQSIPTGIDNPSDWLTRLPCKFAEEFTNIKRISKGAYGKVYSATKKADGITYAIKEIILDSNERSKIDASEARLMAALHNEYVVRYYDNWIEQRVDKLPLLSSDTGAGDILGDESVSSHTSYQPLSTGGAMDLPVNSRLVETSTHDDDDSVQFVGSRSASLHQQPVDGRLAVVKTSSAWSAMTTALQPVRHAAANNHHVNGLQYHKLVLYIQMELCRMTLKDWFEERNKSQTDGNIADVVKDDDNKYILKQMLKGIDYIHSQRMIHRDLKPQNIFLSLDNRNNYRVKIGDFGWSRLLNVRTRTNTASSQQQCSDADVELCTDGLSTGAGNDLYSAPEQLQTTSYSSKADMYSIGLILYELYTPFTTYMERIDCLKQLRLQHNVGDLDKLWPLQANCVQVLTHTNPDLRPSACELLNGDCGLFLTKDQIIKRQNAKLAELMQQVQQKDIRIAELEQRLALRNEMAT